MCFGSSSINNVYINYGNMNPCGMRNTFSNILIYGMIGKGEFARTGHIEFDMYEWNGPETMNWWWPAFKLIVYTAACTYIYIYNYSHTQNNLDGRWDANDHRNATSLLSINTFIYCLFIVLCRRRVFLTRFRATIWMYACLMKRRDGRGKRAVNKMPNKGRN